MPRKLPPPQNICHIFDYFYVSIKVYSAMMIQNVKPGIVAHKGVFLVFVCLLDIRDARHIEIALIPLLDVIVGKMLSPRGDTFPGGGGQRGVAKPTVMDCMGNHYFFYIYQLGKTWGIAFPCPERACFFSFETIYICRLKSWADECPTSSTLSPAYKPGHNDAPACDATHDS